MKSKRGSYFTDIIKLELFFFLARVGVGVKVSYSKIASSETVTFKSLYRNVKALFTQLPKSPKLYCLN